MSRLLVVVHPALAPGFRLAGVETFAAEDSGQAQAIVGAWLDAGEAGLVAIDDELLAGLDPVFRRRLEAAGRLPHIAIPSGVPSAGSGSAGLEPAEGEEAGQKRRVANMIRRVIGFHITFQRESTNSD